MATKIIAPKLGASLDPVLVVEWKVKEGDRVEKGSIILVIETDKIRHDMEAEVSGFVHIVVNEEQEAEIGSAVGFIAETKEELETLQKQTPAQSQTPASQPTPAPATAAEVKPPADSVAPPPVIRAEGERIFISPVARKMAEEHIIDIAAVAGSGPGGRIVRKDIEKAIESKKTTGAPTAPSGELLDGKTVKSTLPLTGIRKTVAEHMHRSLSLAAQLTVMGEIDMTDMVKLRDALVTQEKTLGTRISYTDLMVFFTSKVLREFPLVNSSVIGNEIKQWEDINIAVAVATDSGLIVPVIRNADKKSLAEISQAVKTLAGKARERTLTVDEVRGGTFTITNLGALGGGYRFETVIINQPESGILGTGGITDRAVVRDKQIVIRPIMTYYFTYDHRAMDGAMAAAFIGRLTSLLETPGLLIV